MINIEIFSNIYLMWRRDNSIYSNNNINNDIRKYKWVCFHFSLAIYRTRRKIMNNKFDKRILKCIQNRLNSYLSQIVQYVSFYVKIIDIFLSIFN